MKERKNTKLITIIAGLLLPFFVSCLCQELSIGQGFDLNPNVLFLNYIFWLALLLFFISLFKKNYWGLNFYFAFFFIFTILNRYRIKFLQEPLRFNDINLIGQFPDVIPFLLKYPNFKLEIILSLIGLIAVFWVTKKFIKTEFKSIKTRIALLLVSVLILTSPYFNPKTYNKILQVNKIIFHSWYRLENCQNNGMIICFLNDLQFIKHNEPQNYSQEKIKEICQKNTTKKMTEQSQIKPNIIVIMSESLWDATKLTAIKFNPDPLANMRQDIKGNIVSPTFGGGTANVEFELLTGLSNFLFEDNSYPYTDLIRKKMPSLFDVLKDNGYLTSVIHPYSPQFYNRKNVYKYFEVNKFISLDQMPNTENAGPFVSDKSFTNEILKQFNSTNQSQFIFAISMQNHDLFEPNRFKNKAVKISGSLNKTEEDVLQSYIEGINLTDKSYLFLKEELKKQPDKPTIIIMFGDHLPFLDDDYGIYRNGNFIKGNENEWSQEDKIKMHSTPLIVWNNFQKQIPMMDKIGLQNLSSKILDWANVEPENQFNFVEKLKDKIPYLVKKITEEKDEDKKMIDDYRLLQYDLLFGKGYGRELENKQL